MSLTVLVYPVAQLVHAVKHISAKAVGIIVDYPVEQGGDNGQHRANGDDGLEGWKVYHWWYSCCRGLAAKYRSNNNISLSDFTGILSHVDKILKESYGCASERFTLYG